MEQLNGFAFFPLNFDEDGKLVTTDVWNDLKAHVAGQNTDTDAIFIAHGFRNDEQDARSLYSEFLKNFRATMAHGMVGQVLSSRRFVVAGVFWPAKAFRESFNEDDEGGTQSAEDLEVSQREEALLQLAELRELTRTDEERARIDRAMEMLPDLPDSVAAQDEFVKHVLSIVDERETDPTEGFERVRSTDGADLLEKLSTPVILPLEKREDGEGGITAVDPLFTGEGDAEVKFLRGVFGSIFGRVGQFLNLTTWYVMKNRAGVVGANGVADCVRDLRKDHRKGRVHLVGHSLGGRLMTAAAKALAQDPIVKIDSLTLLQAAFSHFGLSADNRDGTAGFFRDVIDKQVVTGPMVATFSFQDAVVGKAYAISSRLAGDNAQAIGDGNDPFGGIGRNGAQNLKEFASERLHDAGIAYALPPRVVHCLDGSGGLITDHGDVRNERVTWAFASAVAAT